MATSAKKWEDDDSLKNDLKRYVAQKLQRTEVLDYVKRDYSFYKWSMRTLDRRLRDFGIYYNDKGFHSATLSAIVQKAPALYSLKLKMISIQLLFAHATPS